MDVLAVAQEGKNRWMFLSLVLLRQFTFSLPPRPLNYTNGVRVSAVRRLMATTLFRGTNESVWTAAWAICWREPTSTDATTVAAKTCGPSHTLLEISDAGHRGLKCLHTHSHICMLLMLQEEVFLSYSSRWSKLSPNLCLSCVAITFKSHS